MSRAPTTLRFGRKSKIQLKLVRGISYPALRPRIKSLNLPEVFQIMKRKCVINFEFGASHGIWRVEAVC